MLFDHHWLETVTLEDLLALAESRGWKVSPAHRFKNIQLLEIEDFIGEAPMILTLPNDRRYRDYDMVLRRSAEMVALQLLYEAVQALSPSPQPHEPTE